MRAIYIDDPIKWEEDFSFHIEVKVRFSETDMYGHLNNTVPFIYFEEARIEYFKSIGYNEWASEESEKIIVVADLQCDFLKQVYFDETLKIYVKAAHVGTSSVDIHYLVKNAHDQTVFTGRGAMVQINKSTGKGTPWTEKEKLILHGK
ncbi:MAG TPA: thioesterase family protein [Ureibacillus sp.]|nr:thioesterase family protein [Ureibacillus sp.]